MICVGDVVKWTLENAPLLNLLNTLALFVIGYLLQSKARKIQSLMVWNSYREPIRYFANEAIDILSKVEGLCEINPTIKKQEFWDLYNKYVTELSSLRDKGKLLLPNHYPDDYGTDKPSAYRGIRQATLDCLTAGYYVAVAINFAVFANNKEKVRLTEETMKNSIQLGKLWQALSYLPHQDGISPSGHKNRGWSCKSAIIEVKRQFVSECQLLIDPATWIKHIDGVRNA